MEDKGVPTVRDVITKLKSDGTFDNFRKSCANSIENEPLFRAQKEEVEVLSRKFLQRSHWDDKTLKSDVRVHLRNYVLDVLHRPEATNQLGFIAEKILSRKHKEFMTQINEVTRSLQDTASSNYRDENMLYDGVRKKPVKATETAVDLLQSFAISNPSTLKKAPAKSLKQSKPSYNQDAPTAVSKEGPSVVIRNDASKELEDVEDDGVRLSTQCKQHNMAITSSSEEVDYDGVECNDTAMSPIDDDKHINDVNKSFTTLLHRELYPCHEEEPEVKWSSRPPLSTTPVLFMNNYKQYSCFIHPAAPWQRCKRSHQHSIRDVAEVSCSSAVLKDKRQETVCSEERDHDEEKTVKQRDRLRKKRKREFEHISSDSETEPPKISDNPEANIQVAVNPPETRTSKRVRRAPIKLRQ